MEFSTKVMEEVARILVQELEKVETGDEGIMGLETNVREMLKLSGPQRVGST